MIRIIESLRNVNHPNGSERKILNHKKPCPFAHSTQALNTIKKG
jgi:hypothetical protein